jgi:5-hydroxyisourate hydrolase-like protein (transthyretin family)
VGAKGTPYCSSRGRNYIRTFKAQVTVVDPLLPLVRVVKDNALTLGQWVRGEQAVNYDAGDNVGVKAARGIVRGASYGDHWRGCYYAQPTPCPNGPGSIVINTSKLGDGSQTLAVQAQDAADNIATSPSVTVRVDNTAPGAVPVAIEGGEGWRNQNDFDLAWQNPNEGDRAPITAAHYRLCRANGTECGTGSRLGTGIHRIADLSVPAPGEWQVRLWRQDAAGNQEPTNASVPVTLRYDPEPPQLGFEPPPPSDPTRVSVLVTDQVSGLAAGQIEISRQGSGAWQTLATRVEGNRLVARIDDATLPSGTYVLRATARDNATNQNGTDKWVDGRPAVVTLPLRVPTVISAGLIGRRTVRTTLERRAKRREVRREVTSFEPSARVGLGREIRIGGRLENRDGQPLAGAEVQVLSRSAVNPEQPVGAVRTDAQGNYTYTTRANATRTLRFVYHGSPVTLPTASEVSIFVPAESTIRVHPRRLRNGGTVRFGGRLRSLPQPTAGKLIELQVVLSGDWQTFRTTVTNSAGAWHVPYRFRRTCGRTSYRFRARIPAEAGYPFETGVTRPVKVVVRGRPCR